ncbi:hypothetical protein IFR04_012874 [Cadophora malorum]|uniref:Uncharacterized protein n=1 Tax=Cadophora malorum TaxID=108018 RepID=A0A8H7T6F6_9HELO|nr:hypothetical protein IFR04_012874 [Cadophora malorum]
MTVNHDGSQGVATPLPDDREIPSVARTKVNGDIKAMLNGTKNAQTNGINGTSHASKSKYWVPLNKQLAFTPRKIRVITIGAGYSGLIVAHKFQHKFPEMQDMVDHTIFEARSDVGGTWLVNTYPGVQCDVPAQIYAFPFDPNPNWSRFYASGADIQDYIKRTVKKWNLDRDIQLNTQVTRAEWQADQGVWKVTVTHDGKTRDEYAEVLISAQGVLLHHQWPAIPGLKDFKGQVTHSARWDHDFDYSNKRIAVIGNGSSGIQIVPQMANLPGTDVTNFIRGPTWVTYRVSPATHLGRPSDEVNPSYLEEEKKRFAEHPETMRDHRRAIIGRSTKAFRMFIKGGESNIEGQKFAVKQMSEKLGHDPVLCEKLIPKWDLGCRRVTPGPGYLESFRLPNCHLTDSGITKISENAVHTADGKVHEVDVVVCATGFDVSHCPHYPVVGVGGVDLKTKWKDDPQSYMSLAASDMPNYFIMTGPNAVAGHGSLIEVMNWTSDYFVKWIKKIATEDIKSVVPKEEAVEAFNQYGDEVLKTLVWTSDCKSWYKRGTVDGRVTALFGGTNILYKRLIEQIRGEDFNIEYRSRNRYNFFGTGFTPYELDDSNDMAWYVEK